MRNPNPISEQRQKELEAFRKSRWPGEEFLRFLCAWLRIECRLSPAEIGRVLGWHPITARTTQQEFIKHGVEALLEKPRGGRHRALLSFEEETAFLAQFGEMAVAGSILVVAEVRLALEQKLGKQVAESTVYRILHRHGWRKLVPRPFHSKRKPEAAEAFKKGASHGSSTKPESTPRRKGSR
jgi:transposase